MCELKIVSSNNHPNLINDIINYLKFKKFNFNPINFTEIDENIKKCEKIVVIQPIYKDYHLNELETAIIQIRKYTKNSIYLICPFLKKDIWIDYYNLIHKYFNINFVDLKLKKFEKENSIIIENHQELTDEDLLKLNDYEKIYIYESVPIKENLLTNPKIFVIMLDMKIGNKIIEILEKDER